ncbi:MAG TPA: tRNA uridine-5-carboxymethylaminomethyl(34) synthesis GTPase MnmE [Novosphingobium sp.]|nr:tRNA uridine-5-carboxymethylaminomethyl(34) synthesis GTPase MnmE [Novosphingobium sp.]
MTETIFALSSGAPPAAVALVRVSGPRAGEALRALAGRLPEPRRATLADLLEPDEGAPLDRALVLWLPGPGTATGEDTAELHLHGGRAVVAAVERALGALPGLRRAEAGEFTRRAFAHGRLDLAEAEGLADLLAAETELQRRSALAMAEGGLSRQADEWRARVLELSAAVEAALDFSDEDDVAGLPARFGDECRALCDSLGEWVAQPRAELLRDGFRVVLAGPPNAGKSTLFNALTESEAAITSPLAGTTRDVITRSVALDGVPFVFADTAGVWEGGGDPVEAIGIGRARKAANTADLVLWLGDADDAPPDAWPIAAQVDRRAPGEGARHRVSAVTGAGLAELRAAVLDHARSALPAPGQAALGARQHGLLSACRDEVTAATDESDPLIVAEHLRRARLALDRLVGRSGTEDMLDALFGRFCIGK